MGLSFSQIFLKYLEVSGKSVRPAPFLSVWFLRKNQRLPPAWGSGGSKLEAVPEYCLSAQNKVQMAEMKGGDTCNAMGDDTCNSMGRHATPRVNLPAKSSQMQGAHSASSGILVRKGHGSLSEHWTCVCSVC